MNRALLLLMGLRARGVKRRIFRGIKTPRGALLFAVSAVLLGFWVFSVVIGAMFGKRGDPQHVLDEGPLFMLALAVMMAVFSGGKVVSFLPAEIDFLFAGPFRRRQLMAYKIIVSALGAVLVALVMSIWVSPFASSWIAAYIGIVLAWLLAQLLAMLALLARQAMRDRGAHPALRIVLGALLVGMVLCAADLLRPLALGEFSIASIAEHSRTSLPCRIVLAPFDALALTIAAPNAGEFLKWSAASAGICAVALTGVLWLDEYFIDASFQASQKFHQQLKRARSGGGPWAFGGAARPRWNFPDFPWLGGAGPLAWRQFTAASRNTRGVLYLFLIIGASTAPMLLIDRGSVTAATPVLGFVGMWILIILPSVLRFDFRGDANRMDALKSIPAPPKAIVLGQVLAPVVVLCVIHGAIGAIAAVAVESARHFVLVAMCFVPPFNLLMIGIENAAFLIAPTRQQMSTPGDMQMIGRSAVIMMTKALVLLTALGAAATLGLLTYNITGSLGAAIIAAWVGVAALGVATVPLLTRLFDSFDPSLQTPPE